MLNAFFDRTTPTTKNCWCATVTYSYPDVSVYNIWGETGNFLMEHASNKEYIYPVFKIDLSTIKYIKEED
jgi:hypothetical protein